VLGTSVGCGWDRANLLAPPPVTSAPPADTLVLSGEGLVPDKGKIVLVDAKGKPTADARLLAARDAFRHEDYTRAEDQYYAIADNKDTPAPLAAEAIFYRGECLRLQGHYPKAADVYVDLMNKFPHNPYREQALQHMFEIANYWLDDTRQEMREEKERREGKRWFVWPRFISFDKTKPFLDREGRAVEKLEQVRLFDITGPLADQSLFMAGTVKLFNENYREADHYFTQVHKNHPTSKLAPKALELAILCKHMSTGGSDYDGRKVAEARQLVQAAYRLYPDLARTKSKFLEDQLKGITLQQAKTDFDTAAFYQRTGHPGPAYWCYEVVRRRYPGTRYAAMATERMTALRNKLEKEQSALPPPPPPGAPAAAAISSPTPAPPGAPVAAPPSPLPALPH
jgi:outer membrane protein assembly factor BamD (BamD/ComL family)